MQCHRCPDSVTNGGTPNLEKCLACQGAEYLDNDHKTVIPVEDISHVAKDVDHGKMRKATMRPESVPKRVADDCANVLDELKKCHPHSFPHLAKMFMLFVGLGTAGCGIAMHVLNGNSLTEYANRVGISRQAAHQQWMRLVATHQMLRNVATKRRRKRICANPENTMPIGNESDPKLEPASIACSPKAD